MCSSVSSRDVREWCLHPRPLFLDIQPTRSFASKRPNDEPLARGDCHVGVSAIDFTRLQLVAAGDLGSNTPGRGSLPGIWNMTHARMEQAQEEVRKEGPRNRLLS